LRGRIRVGVGRKDLPTAAIIDAQSVKAAETVAAAHSGYDGGNYRGSLVMPGRASSALVGGWVGPG
jgi:hypothetical protein